MNAFFNDFNELQLNAIKSEANRICVYAGPGTGKTKTLVGKYAYLQKEIGVLPANILCLTFTKKAVDEMISKIRAVCGDNHSKYIGTNISNNIDKFGSYDSKTKFRQLKNLYDNESSEENKKYLINEIRNLHVDALFDSFDWLSNYAAFLVNKKVIYVNEQRADYWKNQLAVAYHSHNKQQLQKAVVELISLMEQSANENIGFVMVDLKL